MLRLALYVLLYIFDYTQARVVFDVHLWFQFPREHPAFVLYPISMISRDYFFCTIYKLNLIGIVSFNVFCCRMICIFNPSSFRSKDFSIFLVTNDKIWAHLLPFQTSNSLFSSPNYDSKRIPVIKFYNDICFCVLLKSFYLKQLDQIIIVSEFFLDIIQEVTGLCLSIRDNHYKS